MTMAEEQHFSGKVAQKALIERNGEVLIVRNACDSCKWELPGGRMNVGELPAEGLHRELQEELGVDVMLHRVIAVDQFVYEQGGTGTLVLVYAASLQNEAVELAPDRAELAEVVWVNKDNWQEYDLYPEYKMVVKQFFNQKVA